MRCNTFRLSAVQMCRGVRLWGKWTLNLAGASKYFVWFSTKPKSWHLTRKPQRYKARLPAVGLNVWNVLSVLFPNFWLSLDVLFRTPFWKEKVKCYIGNSARYFAGYENLLTNGVMALGTVSTNSWTYVSLQVDLREVLVQVNHKCICGGKMFGLGAEYFWSLFHIVLVKLHRNYPEVQ
jgi:hypothetical protein